MCERVFRWILIGLVLLPLQSFPNTSNVVYIHDVRISRHPHHWQLVFDASAPLHYRYSTLSKPLRAVFDINNATLSQPLSNAVTIHSPVHAVRVRKQQHHMRLVIEFDHSVKVTHFVLPATHQYPNRLVVDIRGHAYPVVGFGLKPAHSSSPPAHAVLSHTPYKLQPTITSKTMRYQRVSDVIVVIDPGHGGKDPGATGLHGTHEKDVVLAIAKKLQADINRVPGFRAVLTRHGDYFISLRGRLAIARRHKADMFIAIHADAYHNKSAHGVSVFALSQRGATSEAGRWLARQENASELMGGVRLDEKSHLLKSVLINLAQAATVRTSIEIGSDIVDSIGRYEHLHHGKRVEQAAFVVLKSPDIPSLLVESGFITNRGDEHRLTGAYYQRQLAQSISNGICDYFKHHPPRGTSLALHK